VPLTGRRPPRVTVAVDLGQVEGRIASRLGSGDLRGAAEESVRGHGAEVAGYLRVLLRDEEAAEMVASRPPIERSSFADAFAKLRQGLDPKEQALLTLRLPVHG